MFKSEITKNILVFTDLDGTLLDHHNYSFDAALEVLKYLKQNNIPLIIVTSKTLPEVKQLQTKLEIDSPFIFENGAGICIPQDEDSFEIIDLGYKYLQTLNAFNTYASTYKMKGFHQMSNEEVAKHTGLSLKNANMAKERFYSEPFLLEDENDLEDLKKDAQKDGFDITKGGRFYHLITKGKDKASALQYLTSLYNKYYNKTFQTIALGDGENDITMLRSVDIPVLIPKYDGSYINCDIENLTKAKYPGPKGWNDTLKGILDV
jgi:mannosyl-3-phosphoglycerate phosphatase